MIAKEHLLSMQEKERARVRKFNSETYRWRKERGLCVRCGKEPAQKGRVQCWLCRVTELDRRSVVYYREADKQKKHRS